MLFMIILRGVSLTAPSTLERAHSFEFSESVSGVSAVSIDGPQGNLWSRTFNPPVFSTATALNDLPVGDYVATALNSVGEETKAPFLRNFLFPPSLTITLPLVNASQPNT